MMKKRFLKISAILVLGLLVLVVVVAAVTQTAWFRNWLREYTQEKAAQYLDAELTIARLEGNLYREVVLSGVTLTHGDTAVLTLDTLKLGWSPWELLSGTIHIDSLIIDSLHATVIQYQDSTWNVTRLVRPDTLAPEPAPTDTSAAPKLVLQDFIVRRSAVSVNALDTSMPREFNNIAIRLAISNEDTLRDLSLKQFTVDIPDLPLTVKQLSLDAWQRKDSFALENFSITTLRNRFEGTGIYRETDTAPSVGSLKSEPVDFSEFNILQRGVSLHGNPRITATVQYVRDTLQVNLLMTEQAQRAEVLFTLGDVSRLLKSRVPRNISYGLVANIQNLDLASWVGDSSHAYMLNGQVIANGSGISPESALVNLTADFHQSILQGYPVDSFHISGEYTGGDAMFNLFASGDFGEITVDGDGSDLDSNGEYSAIVAVSNLDIATLVDRDSLSSSLNFVANIHGYGLDESMRGTADFNFSRSRINDIAIDTLFLRSAYTSQGLSIDSFQTQTNLGQLSIAGSIGSDSTAALRYSFALDNIAPVGTLFQNDSLQGKVQIDGTMSGSIDAPTVTGQYALDNFRYGAYSVRNSTGSFTLEFADSIPAGSIQTKFLELAGDGFAIDSIEVVGESDGRSARGHVHVQYGDSISADIDASARIGDVTEIHLAKVAAEVNGYSWEGGSDSTRIVILDSAYVVHNLILTSDPESTTPQEILLDGNFSMAGTNDLTLGLSGLQIASLLKAVQNEATFTGELSGQLTLMGTSSAPIIDGQLELNGAASDDYKIEQAEISFHAADELLRMNGLVKPNAEAGLALTGTLPVALAFNHTGDRLLGDRPAELHLVITEFPIKALREFATAMVPTGGVLEGDLHLANTLNNPDLSGTMTISRGTFDIPALDIQYTDFEMRLQADKTTIRLDSLSAKRTGGTMNAKGYVQLNEGLFTGRISAVDFVLHSSGLELAKHKDFEIVLSGDAALKGSSEDATFSGNIVVHRSSVYLPFLMEKAMPASSVDETIPPMLVAATAPLDTTIPPPGAKVADTSDEKGMMEQTDFYRNLRGTVRFSFPRNTWLRSPEMNLEISGDLDLVKHSEDFELFGPVSVVRGHYNLYGRRFTIIEGILRFTGGADYNPELNFTAEYAFRSPTRERRLLEANVTGTAERPIVAFTLDGIEIEERDALAYVVFGRSMDELTAGGGGSLGGQSGQLAKGAAANVLAGQLAQTLGSGLGLDVIDIEAHDSWSAATVTVGKYLTDDLFVSYQRGVGEFEDNDVTPAFVTLEYEIARFLIMQLSQGDPKTNGFDLVFRIGSR